MIVIQNPVTRSSVPAATPLPADQLVSIGSTRAGRIDFVEPVVQIAAGATTALLEIARNQGDNGAASVTVEGTSDGEIDLSSISQVVSWGAGEMGSKFIEIAVPAHAVDGLERGYLRLVSASGAVVDRFIGANNYSYCHITRDNLVRPADSRAWYVSATGDNADAGTQDEPWADIQYAVTNRGSKRLIFVLNDAQFDHEGTYGIELPTMASHSDRLTIMGDPLSPPTIDGTNKTGLTGPRAFFIAANITPINTPGTGDYVTVRGIRMQNLDSTDEFVDGIACIYKNTVGFTAENCYGTDFDSGAGRNSSVYAMWGVDDAIVSNCFGANVRIGGVFPNENSAVVQSYIGRNLFVHRCSGNGDLSKGVYHKLSASNTDKSLSITYCDFDPNDEGLQLDVSGGSDPGHAHVLVHKSVLGRERTEYGVWRNLGATSVTNGIQISFCVADIDRLFYRITNTDDVVDIGNIAETNGTEMVWMEPTANYDYADYTRYTQARSFIRGGVTYTSLANAQSSGFYTNAIDLAPQFVNAGATVGTNGYVLGPTSPCREQSQNSLNPGAYQTDDEQVGSTV